MGSVLDDLRAETRAHLLRMTPAERIRLALALGDADLALRVSARGLTRRDALHGFRLARNRGRRPSCANEPPDR